MHYCAANGSRRRHIVSQAKHHETGCWDNLECSSTTVHGESADFINKIFERVAFCAFFLSYRFFLLQGITLSTWRYYIFQRYSIPTAQVTSIPEDWTDWKTCFDGITVKAIFDASGLTRRNANQKFAWNLSSIPEGIHRKSLEGFWWCWKAEETLFHQFSPSNRTTSFSVKDEAKRVPKVLGSSFYRLTESAHRRNFPNYLKRRLKEICRTDTGSWNFPFPHRMQREENENEWNHRGVYLNLECF